MYTQIEGVLHGVRAGITICRTFSHNLVNGQFIITSGREKKKIVFWKVDQWKKTSKVKPRGILFIAGRK